jgi:tRNA (uracil-5-)-methyltransferase TRM9
MNSQTRIALNAINRDFYAAEASSASFSATRDHAWPGWQRAWQTVRPTPSERATAATHVDDAQPVSPLPVSVLDLGCGNGRFAAFLAAQHDHPIHYVGVDESQPLLEVAAARAQPLASARLLHGDLLDAEGNANASRALAPLASAATSGQIRFDAIVLFGLLHHIPGFETRAALIESSASWLAPGGILALTLWRFGAPDIGSRFKDRIIDWHDYNETASHELDLSQLEPGDHLLRWGDANGPPRYCHYTDPNERDALEETLDLERVDHYHADGRSNDLNEYLVLRQPD